MRAHWCERAFVDGEVRDRVLLGVEAGRLATVDVGVDAPRGARRHAGLTLPGFANAHSHAFHRALRGRTQSGVGSFWTWRDQMFRAAERLDPDRYHRLARAVFAEMALAGITTVGEFHYVHHQRSGQPYDDPNAMGRAVVAAAVEAGVRITLLDTLYLRGGLGVGGYQALGDCQRRFADRDIDRWIERVDAFDVPDDGPARIAVAAHSVRAVDPDSMRRLADWAAGSGRPVHVHAAEQADENERCLAVHRTTPIGMLTDAGVLGPNCTAVHAVHVDDVDIAALSRSGATVCACPTTERDLADGIAPTALLAGAGVPIALGTDSHAVVDLFEEMRALEMHARLVSNRRGQHSPEQLLEAATAAGHRCLGWDDSGAIAVGHRADLVSVDLGSVRTAGGDADLASVVFSATATDVIDVVVDGRDVVIDGAHASIDVVGELDASIGELMHR